MKHIYNISKLAVILNCLIFVFYYCLQFGLLIGSIFFEFDSLAITIHNIPILYFASEIETGIFVSFPSKMSLLQFFTFPMLLYVILSFVQFGIINVIARFDRQRGNSQVILAILILFIVLFFFDKRALIGLLGTMGMLLVLRVREQGLTNYREYSFIFGRLAFLVAVATEIGDLSYRFIEYFFNKTLMPLHYDINYYEEMSHQIIPDPIVNLFTYILGTILFLLSLAAIRSVIIYTMTKSVRPSFVLLLYAIGMIVIIERPFFGAFFIVSAVCFTFSSDEDDWLRSSVYEVFKLERTKSQKPLDKQQADSL
ncbi:MAG: hypothetical protein ACRDCC_06905 [Culicoidibacterales bacterium]